MRVLRDKRLGLLARAMAQGLPCPVVRLYPTTEAGSPSDAIAGNRIPIPEEEWIYDWCREPWAALRPHAAAGGAK